MAREFTRNIFIMLLAIMVGVIIITFFIADIVNQSKIYSLRSEHKTEIASIEENNLNFTNNFLESSVLLDSAREDRAFGNYHFDLASLFYTSALSEKNVTKMEQYKNISIENATKAMPIYMTSYLNFLSASAFFDKTKQYTTYEHYHHLLNLYVNLTKSGAKLTMLRYNASNYLKVLTEMITYMNGTAVHENVTDLLLLFNETLFMYGAEFLIYTGIEDEIQEYDIMGFDPRREPY